MFAVYKDAKSSITLVGAILSVETRRPSLASLTITFLTSSGSVYPQAYVEPFDTVIENSPV